MTLIPIWKKNCVAIFLCIEDDRNIEIGRFLIPSDNQIIKNADYVKDIIKAMEKRISSM